MATINYIGPEDFGLGPGLYDIEFDLLSGDAGRAIALSDSPENAVTLTEQELLDLGYSINNADVYDVVYVDIYVHPVVDISAEYKVIVVGTTASG